MSTEDKKVVKYLFEKCDRSDRLSVAGDQLFTVPFIQVSYTVGARGRSYRSGGASPVSTEVSARADACTERDPNRTRRV